MSTNMAIASKFWYNSTVFDANKLIVAQIDFVKQKTKDFHIFENLIVDHLIQNNHVWILFWWLGYYEETVMTVCGENKFDVHLGRVRKFVERCNIADLQG